MTDPNLPAGWPAPSQRNIARLFFTSALLLTLFALRQLYFQGQGSGHALAAYSWRFVVLLGLVILSALISLILLMLLFTSWETGLSSLLKRGQSTLLRAGGWVWLGVAAPWVAFVVVVIFFYDRQLGAPIVRQWLFFLVAGVGAFFLHSARPKLSFFWAFLATAVVYGLGLKAISYLPEITSYPFTLSWSEASRYYYASLPFAKGLYGMPVPLSPWHASRYLLQGLPFLFPDSSIFVHRLWQVILWLVTSAGTGYLLARRVGIRGAGTALVFSAWAGLFLLQGPVYYHLLVCVMLVLAGFDRRRFWKSLLFVVLASLWAGISRVNWIVVPAFLAAMLYLLERPLCEVDQNWRGWQNYLSPPVLWGIAGGISALFSQAVYMRVSGNTDISNFGSAFTSDLLWYRLLPSPTSGIGVLPAILIVTLPLLVVVAASWLQGRSAWHPLRLSGIFGMLVVLFIGGLVVSTKIGGGSNIHNLDAYLVIVLVLGAYLIFNRPRSEHNEPMQSRIHWLLALVIVAVPVIWNMNIGQPFLRKETGIAESDLGALQEAVRRHAGQGEVLFITQRQLLVFHFIQNVPLVPNYELLTLSEMAISNNSLYLQGFTEDLANHRFALIVADTQRDMIQDPRKDAFAEENNAWVEHISRPILANYQTEMVLPAEDIRLYVPKP